MTFRDITMGDEYIHFKYGTEYIVVGFGRGTTDLGVNVLYTEKVNYEQYLEGNIIPWSRDIIEFSGYKEVDGKMVKRFTKVGG